MSLLSSYSTVIPCRPETCLFFFFGHLFLSYDVWKLLTESPRGNRTAIQDACELIKNEKMAALSGLSFHRREMRWREKKIKCPIQKSNLGWTSPVWYICCSLGRTTQDWSGDTSEHCLPLGTPSCRRTASQIHLLPGTKGLDDKKLHTVLTCPVADHVKWSKTINISTTCAFWFPTCSFVWHHWDQYFGTWKVSKQHQQ